MVAVIYQFTNIWNDLFGAALTYGKQAPIMVWPFSHLKVIGYTPAVEALFAKASIADDLDEGVVDISSAAGLKRFIEAAKLQRVWDRVARISGPR